jgi:hypothetical protein
MTTYSRTFRSSPHRDAIETWGAIVDLLTQGKEGEARQELQAVAGVAASLIADRAPEEAPIVAVCKGPRTRVYCLYDEDAVGDTDANEDPLGYDALVGDWAVSLPCPASDLGWVERALSKHGSRITARDMTTGFAVDSAKADAGGALILDVEGFLKP